MKQDIKKTVEVSVFWRIEDTAKIEVPYETSLRDVRDMIVWDDDQFDITNGCMTEFDVYLIEDEEGNEWQL
tara:strand:+ start:75 stop:287 length:213 start_codon:yes stop_codon:yes gene_type:complete